jgi:hypothetical protein
MGLPIVEVAAVIAGSADSISRIALGWPSGTMAAAAST